MISATCDLPFLTQSSHKEASPLVSTKPSGYVKVNPQVEYPCSINATILFLGSGILNNSKPYSQPQIHSFSAFFVIFRDREKFMI